MHSNDKNASMIDEQIQKLRKKLLQNLHGEGLAHPEYKISDDFYKKYHFKNDKQCYLINSLAQLGISPPFPTENADDPYLERRKKSYMFYKKSRLQTLESPKCIYMPTEAVMFTLMRACIEVEHIEELWYYFESA